MDMLAPARIITSTQTQTNLSTEGAQTHSGRLLRCVQKPTYSHTHGHIRQGTEIKGMRQDLLICGSRIKHNTIAELCCVFWINTHRFLADEAQDSSRGTKKKMDQLPRRANTRQWVMACGAQIFECAS